MKVGAKKQVEKATRIFTDREEPRAAFWGKYNDVKKEMSEESNVHVLTYYGIGGIGKSSLLKKLICEMQEQIPNPRYVYLDFEKVQESRAVLSKLSTYMAENFRFSFPLFELATYIYAKKAGEKVDPAEVKRLTEKSPLLSIALKVVDAFTGSIVTKLFEIGDESFAYFKNRLSKHKQDIMRMEYIEADELYKNLPYYFALDMAHNLEKETQPLVIFFDTYEKIVNELSSIGEPLNADLWIRGERGIVQNIPGVLWVIAGREKLKWEQFDSDWSSALEQHILGNLSYADSDYFLANAGIEDQALRDDLYKLTKGTPVYLDLCVDSFTTIQGKGETPDISMFGSNTYDLIERFVRYMDSSVKDMVYMFACVQKWDDEFIFEIAPKSIPSFSMTSYEKTKDFSFITESDDGTYAIHQTIGEVLEQSCPEILKKRVANVLIETFAGSAKGAVYDSVNYAMELSYLLRGGMLLNNSREEFVNFYRENLRRPLTVLADARFFDTIYRVFDVFFDYAMQKKDDALYILALRDKAYCLESEGKDAETKEILEEVLDLSKKVFGPDDPETFVAMNNLAYTLSNYGYYEDALAYQEELVKQKEEVLYMENLAITLSRMRKWDRVIELYEKINKKLAETYDEDAPIILLKRIAIAGALRESGQKEKAREIYENLYQKKLEFKKEYQHSYIKYINNLATGFKSIGDFEKSLELYDRAIEKSKKVYGEASPFTLRYMYNRVLLLNKLGKNEEALENSRQIYVQSMENQGENNSQTLDYMVNLAKQLEKSGNNEEALKYQTEAFRKQTEFLGQDHRDTIASKVRLAQILENLGETEEAIRLIGEAIDQSKKVSGEDNQDLMLYMQTRILMWTKHEKFDEALEPCIELLGKSERLSGKEAERTRIAAAMLVTIYWVQGEKEQAFKLIEDYGLHDLNIKRDE